MSKLRRFVIAAGVMLTSETGLASSSIDRAVSGTELQFVNFESHKLLLLSFRKERRLPFVDAYGLVDSYFDADSIVFGRLVCPFKDLASPRCAAFLKGMDTSQLSLILAKILDHTRYQSERGSNISRYRSYLTTVVNSRAMLWILHNAALNACGIASLESNASAAEDSIDIKTCMLGDKDTSEAIWGANHRALYSGACDAAAEQVLKTNFDESPDQETLQNDRYNVALKAATLFIVKNALSSFREGFEASIKVGLKTRLSLPEEVSIVKWNYQDRLNSFLGPLIPVIDKAVGECRGDLPYPKPLKALGIRRIARALCHWYEN